MGLISRLLNLLRDRRFEQDIDEELQFHIEMRARQHASDGLDESSARAAARRQFGNRTRVRELTRGADVFAWVESLLQDVRFGMRQLRRSLVSTILCALTLALGLGANLALFSILDAVLLKPLPYPQADRLVTLTDHFPTSAVGPTVPEFLDFEAGNQSFEAMAFFDNRDISLTGGPEPERVYVSRVSDNFFRLLGFQPALGRLFSHDAGEPGSSNFIVLSDRFWLAKFGGNPGVVGKKVLLNDAPCIILGVLPPQASLDFAALGVTEPVDLYSPFPMNDPGYTSRSRGSANSRRVHVLAKLRRGATEKSAMANMTAVAARLTQSYPQLYRGLNNGASDFAVDVRPLREDIVRDGRNSLEFLIGAVALILLLACVNSAHARLAQALTRQREFAVRGALGASRSRLIRQVLIENCLLAVMAVALAAAFAGAILRITPAQLSAANPLLGRASLDGHTFALAAALLIGTTMLVGLAPALSSSGIGARLTLRGASVDDRGSQRLRGFFLIAEIAFAFTLVVGAGLLLRSLLALQTQATGFSADHVLTMQMRLPYAVERTLSNPAEAYQHELAALAQVPGLESAAFATSLPLRGFAASLSLPDRGQDEAATARQNIESQIVSSSYFSVLRIPLVAGRVFTDDDNLSHPPVVIVNRATTLRFSNGGNALGAIIRINGVPRTICGIVSDVRVSPAEASPVPQIYLPYLQSYEPNVTLIVRAEGDVNNIFPDVRQALLDVYPNQAVFHVMTMESILYGSVAGPRLMATLIGILASLSLTMATFGLYGTIAYLVARRIPEIAIRLALGARRRDIVSLVVRRITVLTVIGLTLGVGVSLTSSKLISGFLYGVRATDPLNLAGACLLFGLVASAAAIAPLFRALSTRPASVLRSD